MSSMLTSFPRAVGLNNHSYDERIKKRTSKSKKPEIEMKEYWDGHKWRYRMVSKKE